jgi:hypothetical protein
LTFDIPLQVVGIRDLDVRFVIRLDLVINGRPVSLTVDDHGQPFTVRWALHGIGLHPPMYLWYADSSESFSWDPGG